MSSKVESGRPKWAAGGVTCHGAVLMVLQTGALVAVVILLAGDVSK